MMHPEHARPSAEGGSGEDWRAQVGVTRIDLVCGPHVVRAAVELASRWGSDRALPDAALGGLTALVHAAMTHGMRFDPRAVSIAIRWIDLDRVRVDASWKGCSAVATPSQEHGELESTAATLDTYAEDWGCGTGRSGPILWLVLDTR